MFQMHLVSENNATNMGIGYEIGKLNIDLWEEPLIYLLWVNHGNKNSGMELYDVTDFFDGKGLGLKLGVVVRKLFFGNEFLKIVFAGYS